MKLANRVAVVTGASSGLGEAMVRRFAAEGAQVVAVARRAGKLEELAASMSGAAGAVFPCPADMYEKEDIRRMIDFAVERCGHVDILVNNAGRNDDFAAVGDMDDALWDDVMKLNLYAPFYASKYAMPQLIERRGCIINIASIGGTEYGRSGVAYTASKHGLVAMTKHTAFSYATRGVRTNVICPGPVNTPMVEAALHANDQMNQEGVRRANSGMRNLPRIGEAEEIANIACFLASDESSLMNGAVLVADSGWTSY
jgi:NAD(P)-dependent dehydrogenase (short-subunit alcohol dehydrogenase family)